MLYKAVVFRLDGELPSEAKLLMEDFRLAVNCAVRAGFQAKVSSRHALVKLLYKGFREEHPNMYSQHLVCSFEVAFCLIRSWCLPAVYVLGSSYDFMIIFNTGVPMFSMGPT